MVEGIAISVAGLQDASAKADKAARDIAKQGTVTSIEDVVDLGSGGGSGGFGVSSGSLESSIVALKTAALMYKADLADGVVRSLPEWEKAIRAEIDAAWETRVAKEIRPAVEREVRAKLSGEEPPADLSSGAATGGQSDRDFLVAYGEGRSNDHRRARQLTGTR